MAEKLPESIMELPPNSVLEFGDITELPFFEDMLALEIDPDMTAEMLERWQGRISIKDLIKPSKFWGTIGNMRLKVVEDPYERLHDARERGWKFDRRGGGIPSHIITNDHASETIARYRGFSFIADALSNGRVVDQIGAELWYGPVPTESIRRKDGRVDLYRQINNNAGSSVRRFVTKPEKDPTKFIDLDLTAKRIGFQVLRKAMKYPIRLPVHN